MLRYLLLLALVIPVFGCGSSEPEEPPPEKVEQEIEQLNEHRQREWNNE